MSTTAPTPQDDDVPRTADGVPLAEQGWANPFPPQTPIHDLFGRRVRNNQDLVIVVDDYFMRRGTGKTSLCLQMGEGMNLHGPLTRDHVSVEAEELRNAYTELPPRSALVLDEAEIGVSNRQTQTNVNKSIREIVSTGRVEEKYVLLNAPSKNFIDKHLIGMASVWITVLRKGLARIHFLKPNPYSGDIHNPEMGYIEWNPIAKGTQLRDIYNYLTGEKRKHIRGERGQGKYLTKAEAEEMRKKSVEQTERSVRDELMANLYDLTGDEVTFETLGRAAGLSDEGARQAYHRWRDAENEEQE